MQGTVQGLSDQLPDMKTAIKELDQTLHPRLNEHKKTIDSNFVEPKKAIPDWSNASMISRRRLRRK